MSTPAILYETKSLLWRIPNFAAVCASDELLKKQHFKFEMSLGVIPAPLPDATLKWECWLEAEEEEELRISLFLPKVPAALSKCHGKVKVQVAGKGKEAYYLDDEFIGSLKDFKIGLTNMNGLPRQSPSFLTADGTLEISVTVTVFHPAAQDPELAATLVHCGTWFKTHFTDDLDAIREQPLNISSTATKMVSKDGVQFPVDRVILAARSPVFLAMFQSPMRENEGGVVEVKDMEGKALEALLHFIHKGELCGNWREEGVIEGLVYGAHKYMLKDLLEFLDQVVGLVCTGANCGKLMGLAKTLELEEAQKRLMKYFQKNMANDLDKVVKFAAETTNAVGMLGASEESGQPENGERKQRKKRKIN